MADVSESTSRRVKKKTNSTIKNNPRRNGQSPFRRKKIYINARKVNKIHRRGLAVNIRKYWQQNDENRRSITTKNDEF